MFVNGLMYYAQFWVSLLDISCPHECLRQWHNMISDIVGNVVSKVSVRSIRIDVDFHL